jgi:hypothetical protein
LNKGFTSRSSLDGGTRGSELFDTFPFLIDNKIFRKCRGRRRRRDNLIFRYFDVISVLIFFSLRGFRNNRSQIRQKRPLLWKGRA